MCFWLLLSGSVPVQGWHINCSHLNGFERFSSLHLNVFRCFRLLSHLEVFMFIEYFLNQLFMHHDHERLFSKSIHDIYCHWPRSMSEFNSLLMETYRFYVDYVCANTRNCFFHQRHNIQLPQEVQHNVYEKCWGAANEVATTTSSTSEPRVEIRFDEYMTNTTNRCDCQSCPVKETKNNGSFWKQSVSVGGNNHSVYLLRQELCLNHKGYTYGECEE